MNHESTDADKKQRNILIVDDHPENLRLLAGMLGKNGYAVRPAINGSLAIESVKANLPDLILLDIIMPGLNGYEVCKQLKEDEKTRDIPVIFISALDEVFDKVRAFEVGGVDYITKPFQIEEILSRVKTHLSLQEMRKKLEQANEELELRVEHRTKELAAANKELQKAKEAAESASRAKIEFIANISHELRTPLNPIIGLTDLLLLTKPNPDQQEYLDIIKSSSMSLLNMINDLIELSRMEADGIQSENHPFNLQLVLKASANILSFKAKSKGLTMTSRIVSDIPETIIGDRDLLEKILQKIGENAIKFTEKGEIVLSVSKGSENDSSVLFHFSISDTGVGIPADKLEKIFMDFSQADGSSKRRHGGMGLGLTIVRRLINTMGGKLWAESIEHKGSTFHFIIPFALQ